MLSDAATAQSADVAHPPCVGCLGTRECWVCLGIGAIDRRDHVVACASCDGSRVCRYCHLDGSPRRRVTDLHIDLTD